MGHLELAFLGMPRVSHAGQALVFPTRKTLALLIYLSSENGRHTREKITALFWPDSDARRARNTMRRTLSYLRQTLEGEEHLIVSGDSLSFDFTSDYHLDLDTLHLAWALARAPLVAQESVGGRQPNTRPILLTQFQTSIDLYHGDFLEGFTLDDAPLFDGWLATERESWHRRLDLILDRASQGQAEAGEISRAIDTATRWAAHNPFNEEAYRRLMQLHLAAGDRPRALQTYEACRAFLAQELNTRPAPETEELAARIRSQAVPAYKRPPGARTLSPSPRISAPLIGRANEHSHLVTAYYTAANGRLQVVTIEGEAGMGKTRLADDFLKWAIAQGADVVQGKAFETGGRLPYQPLVQTLRSRIEQENAPEDLLSDIWLAELSRLLPELHDRYPDLPLSRAEDAAARTRLFEAVVRLGQALATRAPLMLFVDDIQWADAASLDLLHYAGSRWAEGGSAIFLLFSFRSEDVGGNALLAEWLASLERDTGRMRLALRSLTEEETGQLVQSLLDEEDIVDDRPFSRWLFGETRGQPFYLMETLQVLAERGLLHLQADREGAWLIDTAAGLPDETRLRAASTAGGSVSPGIQELIRARLKHLASESLSLVSAGSVLGHRFSFEQLCRVAGLSEDTGLPALETLIASHLFQEGRAAETGSYFFSHDKIRHVAYDEISEARRRLYHRRALDLLQETTTPAAELARHALAAGLFEAAFRHSLAAGDEALRLFAIRDAITYYEQARQIIRATPRFPPLDTLPTMPLRHLYTQLGRAYELSGDFEKAQELYQGMLALAQELNEPGMSVVALNHLATLSATGGNNPVAAAAYLHEALATADKHGDKEGLAETEWNLAQISFYNFDAETARRHGQRALALARDLEAPELIARCLSVNAYAETIPGNWAAVEPYANEAVALYAALGNRALEADTLALVGKAQINCGRTQAGITTARQALAISMEIENPWGQANGAKHLALGLLERGDYGEALAVVQQGITAARSVWYGPMLAFNLTMLGIIQRAMLSLDAARATHLEVVALNEKLPGQPFAKTIAAELCADYALAGRWQEAHTYARQALVAPDITMIHSGLTHWLEIEALLHGGDTALAREMTQRFGARFGENPRYQIPYRRSLAVLAQWEGKIDQAVGHLEAAGALVEALSLPGEQWPIKTALAALLEASSNDARAREARQEAATIVYALAGHIDDVTLRATFLAGAAKSGIK